VLEKEFEQLYLKFRVNYCKNLFGKVNQKDGSLSATESYVAEVIYLLNRPTVREFADYIHISLPNASYKINQLIKKGYIKKINSEQDKREYHLEITDKFLDYYGANASFHTRLMEQIKEEFTDEEVNLLENMIHKIVDGILL
jgi:DNA-binding MarR family transcriptional regulator